MLVALAGTASTTNSAVVMGDQVAPERRRALMVPDCVRVTGPV